MAVLTAPCRRPALVPLRRALLLALLPLTVLGCVVFDAFGPPPPLAFSHRKHVVDESLDCGDCHLTWEDADDPGMPTMGQCRLCHEKLDAEKPPDRRIDLLFDGKTYRAAHAAKLPGEVIFSHRAHVSTSEKCGDCHRGIEQSERIEPGAVVTMDACTACHATASVPDQCATCHREIREDREPPTHAHDWLRQHGEAVRAAECETAADRCSLCHDKATCQNCHQNELPASHSNFFRRRGHGLLARMDRENCAACHRADSCESCHSQARPMSHGAAFGGTRSTHCLSCHLPLQGNDCAVCHQGTPSHALASPMPPDHRPGLNCRQCHGVDVRLPHVDKGDNCTSCHR